MLQQEKLINKIKEKCEKDARISACMMYGSFTKGEGDRYSDVEFYIFLNDNDIEQFVSSEWIREIAPFDLLFFNEFGTEVVVFSNLVRGEFHFKPISEIEVIKTFKGNGMSPDVQSMFVYDDTGKLQQCLDYLDGDDPERMTNENVNFAFNNFVNAWLMGINVLKRGEVARAAESLTLVQRYVLQLIRIREKNIEHWVNATKNLENEISDEAYSKFVATTSKVEREALEHAFSNALNLVEELVGVLGIDYQFNIDSNLIKKLKLHLTES